MKPFIKEITAQPSTIQSKTVLSQHGVTCTLLSLAAGDKTPLRESGHVEEQILYAIEGQATVHFDDINTVLDRDHALTIAKGRAHSISAPAGVPARLLRVEIPPRPATVAEIVTLAS